MKTKTSMTIIIAFLMLTGSALMGSCVPIKGVKGDGNVVKEDRKVSGFTSLEVSGAFNVYLYQGKTESLTVEADQNLMELIKTEVKGDRLEIYTEGKNIRDYTELNIYLSFKDLEMIDISGAVSITAEDKLIFDKLNIDGSGASEITLNMDVNMFDADISGASEIELMGKAETARFDFSGASEIDAFDFVIEHCELDVSGASEARIHVNGSLDVDVSGAADVKYKGSPSLKSDISGAASLRSY
ncbi:MAG: head GIN domain-containing protein [Bacteroidota bacterium]